MRFFARILRVLYCCAVSLAFWERPDFTVHEHQCSKCFTVWSHCRAEALAQGKKKSHTCPTCGREQYMKGRLPLAA